MSAGHEHAGRLPSAQQQPGSPARSPVLRYERIALVDLLDRLLAGGVVISGEVRLAIADVDLVNISLRALISSVSSVLEHGPAEPAEPAEWKEGS
jgi:hypothetical protein